MKVNTTKGYYEKKNWPQRQIQLYNLLQERLTTSHNLNLHNKNNSYEKDFRPLWPIWKCQRISFSTLKSYKKINTYIFACKFKHVRFTLAGSTSYETKWWQFLWRAIVFFSQQNRNVCMCIEPRFCIVHLKLISNSIFPAKASPLETRISLIFILLN